MLGITILLVILCAWAMIHNLYKVAGGVELTAGIEELKPATEPFSRAGYEDLIKGFKEPYTPGDVHKRNIFSQPKETLVEVPKIEPGITGEIDYTKPELRFRVTKIYKKPVRLLFKGYIQLGDGTYVATINWAGKTDFKKVNDEIRGYKVVDFKKDVSEAKTLWGGTEKVDKSVITLQRDTGERFGLEMGKITLEKEIYAEIWDRKETRGYEVYIGADLFGNKIFDISPGEAVILTPSGEKIYLHKE